MNEDYYDEIEECTEEEAEAALEEAQKVINAEWDAQYARIAWEESLTAGDENALIYT